MFIQIFYNGIILPTKREPQRALFLSLPSIKLAEVKADIRVGVSKVSFGQDSVDITVSCIVFGFGFLYNVNHD
jgi:hypothetical protein